MTPDPTLLAQIGVDGNKNFRSAEQFIRHLTKNVLSFWLDYSAKRVAKNLSVTLFANCGRALIDAELSRNMYDNITCPKAAIDLVKEEIARLVRVGIKEEFEAGHYLTVRNWLVDQQAKKEQDKVDILAVFRKT